MLLQADGWAIKTTFVQRVSSWLSFSPFRPLLRPFPSFPSRFFSTLPSMVRAEVGFLRGDYLVIQLFGFDPLIFGNPAAPIHVIGEFCRNFSRGTRCVLSKAMSDVTGSTCHNPDGSNHGIGRGSCHSSRFCITTPRR